MIHVRQTETVSKTFLFHLRKIMFAELDRSFLNKFVLDVSLEK